MKHGKIDSNQRAIVTALRSVGASVVSLADLGKGVPDVLCWHVNTGYLLLEIKDGTKPPSQRKLTEAEAEWHRKWRGPIEIVNSVDEALALITRSKNWKDGHAR